MFIKREEQEIRRGIRVPSKFQLDRRAVKTIFAVVIVTRSRPGVKADIVPASVCSGYIVPLLGVCVYMRYKVVNTSGSIMEQRTAPKQVGNMPSVTYGALLSSVPKYRHPIINDP